MIQRAKTEYGSFRKVEAALGYGNFCGEPEITTAKLHKLPNHTTSLIRTDCRTSSECVKRSPIENCSVLVLFDHITQEVRPLYESEKVVS